jgi:hypothetical protein
MSTTTTTDQPTTATPAPTLRKRAAAAQPIGGEWCVGLLEVGATGGWCLRSGALHLSARRAASCLLEPAAGDSVACLRIAPDEVWIMAVLQREEGTVSVLRSPGPLRIAVDEGALELQATDIELTAQQLRVAADSAEVAGRQLSVIGSGIKIVGSALSSVMDRVQHFSRHYLRTTDGVDRVSATHIECEARQLLRLEGEHTLINGEKLVKARGAQIHFG